MTFFINHMYIFLSIIFAVSSQLIIKWKMSEHDLSSHVNVFDKFYYVLGMLLNPFIILSIFFTLLSGLSWMIAMSKFDISYAYPFTTLGFVLVFAFSIFLFNEPFTWQKLVGLVLIVAGIIVTSRSA